MDTRPEDLIVTPVLTPDRRVEYHASSVVSAMPTGGIAILDEGNRMPERAWASLAPLMDDRRTGLVIRPMFAGMANGIGVQCETCWSSRGV
jgi:hypothetical protein